MRLGACYVHFIFDSPSDALLLGEDDAFSGEPFEAEAAARISDDYPTRNAYHRADGMRVVVGGIDGGFSSDVAADVLVLASREELHDGE